MDQLNGTIMLMSREPESEEQMEIYDRVETENQMDWAAVINSAPISHKSRRPQKAFSVGKSWFV